MPLTNEYFSPAIREEMNTLLLEHKLLEVNRQTSLYEILAQLGIIPESQPIVELLDKQIQSPEDYMGLFGESGIFAGKQDIEKEVINYFGQQGDRLLHLATKISHQDNIMFMNDTVHTTVSDPYGANEQLVGIKQLAGYRHIGNVYVTLFPLHYLRGSKLVNGPKLLSRIILTDRTFDKGGSLMGSDYRGVREREEHTL